MTPIQLTRNVRSLNRLRQIAQVLSLHGFGHVIAQLDMGRFLPARLLGRRKDKETSDPASSVGRRLAAACTELGPTFIKLGQVLSTRRDIVPPEVLLELKRLQDHVGPFDSTVARQIIEKELGRPPEECFSMLADEPFASASIGQVYRAKVGEADVVVKVRRPEIDQTIRTDMHLLRWMAESIESLMPELRVYRPVMLVDELDQTLTRELDYVNEASATERFSRAFEDVEGIHIPEVYWELTGEAVLTMEAIDGQSVEALIGKDHSGNGIDRKLVARRLSECYLTQIFELGSFHADPHPGNILVEATGTVSLIDFGQIGTLGQQLMTEMVVMTYAAINREFDVVVETLADMGAVGRDTHARALRRALEVLLTKYHGLPLRQVELGTLFAELTDVIRRHDVVMPRDLSLMLKAVSTLGSVTRELDPDLNLLELIEPKIKKALRDRFRPEHVGRSTAIVGWDIISLLRHGPRQIRTLLRRITRDGWELHVRHENLDRLIAELDQSSNRLAFSVVIAAIIVGSSLVITSGNGLQVLGIEIKYLGLLGYVIAGVLGLGLAWAIFRSGRLH